MINANPTSLYRTISIDCPIKEPLKRAKSLVALDKIEITHIFDYESNDEIHVTEFRTTLDRMKQSQSLGKSIKYLLGYSNFTFELWMVLHKIDFNVCLSHRKQYITFINRAYAEKFENLDHYKQEDNFKRILDKLTLEDVKCAIQRSKDIMQKNQTNGYSLHQYKGFQYYKENPSLSIWEAIEKILLDSGLLV